MLRTLTLTTGILNTGMLNTGRLNTGRLHPGSQARARPTDGPPRPCPGGHGATLIQIKTARGGVAHGRPMGNPLQALAAWCGHLGAGLHPGLLAGGVYAGLLLAGAAGSVVHCAPMCGPFVLGQVSDRLARLPGALLCERQRIGSALLLPYHAGRLITYAALGALAGEGGAALGRLAWFGWLSGILLGLAALLFLGHALRRLAPSLAWLVPGIDRAPGGWVRLIRRLSARAARTRPTGGLLLGLALGFLPCGFLYAALAVAAATGGSASGGPLAGAAAMLCFGLGTVPSLVAVGIAGHAAGRAFHRGVTALAPAVLLLNAGVLGVLAWQRLAALG